MSHLIARRPRVNPDPSPTTLPLLRWYCCWTDLSGQTHSSIPFDDPAVAEKLIADLKKCPLVLRAWLADSTQLKPLGGKAVR